MSCGETEPPCGGSVFPRARCHVPSALCLVGASHGAIEGN